MNKLMNTQLLPQHVIFLENIIRRQCTYHLKTIILRH